MITRFADQVNETVAATHPEAWKSQVDTGFGENAWAMAKQTARERLAVSGMMAELHRMPGEEHFASAPDVARGMLRDGTLTPEEVAFAWTPSPDWEDDSAGGSYDWDKIGKYIREKAPETKLDLRSERLERRSEIYDTLRAEEEDVALRSTGMGKVGMFAGAMPVYMADPPNVVAMVMSPWSSAVGASRTAGYMAVAGEQLLVEGVTAVSVAEHRQSLGLEYGSKEIAMDIGFSVVGGVALKGAIDAGSALKSKISAMKASPAAQTPEGQKVIKQLTDASDEVDLAAAAGRPLDEVLEETDRLVARAETPLDTKDITDPEAFPEVKDYDQDAIVAADVDQMISTRGPEADDSVVISAREVDGKIEVEYGSMKEIRDGFDAEIEKNSKMRACFGL